MTSPTVRRPTALPLRLLILPVLMARLAGQLAIPTAGAAAAADTDIGFLETFALADDREATLGQLVPGTEEHEFFHALHYQSSGQDAKFAETLARWAERVPESEQRRMLENRQALLDYAKDPQRTLRHLRDRLQPRLDHVRRLPDQTPDLPTALDASRVSREAFLAKALASDALEGLDVAETERLVRDGTALRPAQLRAALARLTRPDVPGLVPRIVEHLKSAGSRGFGEFQIHRALLPEQLDALQKALPALGSQPAFVMARLRGLSPGADADAGRDPAEREAWLERIGGVARGLPASFNSLKAHVLVARLRHDRTRGVYDRERFLEYLRLPRPAPYLSPRWLETSQADRHAADLNATFPEAGLGLPPVGNDEPLVREFLLHFATTDASWEPWTEWLRDSYVKPIFAEAKVTRGVGKPEDWAPLLSPAAFQALRDRVDIEFPATNAPSIPVDEEVAVTVTLKNTPQVLVRLFEIDTLGWFLAQKRPLGTDLPLEGWVANAEQRHAGDPSSPFLRTTRRFGFPELRGRRGAWIVEVIGGGRSSRALIRRGGFSLLQSPGPGGDLLRVLDERSRVVTNAVAWLDGRRWEADPADGRIQIPFTTSPGRRPIVLSDAGGRLASLAEFEHHAETASLEARFHLDPEQCVAGAEAVLAVRASLLLAGQALTPGLLAEPRLILTTVRLDEVATRLEVPLTNLSAARVITQGFRVPGQLARVEARLEGWFEPVAGGERRRLEASARWNLNGIERTRHLRDAFLRREGDRHRIEVLGRNGEPVPDEAVRLAFRRRGFAAPVEASLRSDARGRIDLGSLEGLAGLTATMDGDLVRTWSLEGSERTRPREIHARAGEVVRVPWFPQDRPDAWSLIEVRGGVFAADHSARVRAAGDQLEITGLPPGDHSLRLRDPEESEITLRVSESEPVAGWLVGRNRSLERPPREPVHLASVTLGADGGAEIVVRNAGPLTRVHVVAGHFLPAEGLFAGLGGFTRWGRAMKVHGHDPDLYSGGREIGDEYRYILDRRYAPKHAGNPLPRPGLLLQPWDRRSTEPVALPITGGERPEGVAAGSAGRMAMADALMARKMAVEPVPTTPGFDFLATPAVAWFNRIPDADGRVRLPAGSLGDRTQVQVQVEDEADAAWRLLTRPSPPGGAAELAVRDLRLDRTLDVQGGSSEVRESRGLARGQSLPLGEYREPRWEAYGTLASVFGLLRTLNPDPELARFDWLMRWPSLSPEEQRARYSEFACHEVNLFLRRKDPRFFEAVIRPHLANKRDRTFLDDYLLDADLSRYLQPRAHGRLNLAERALLAGRIDGEAATTARHLGELLELRPADPEAERRWFETALGGRALEPGGGGGAPSRAMAPTGTTQEQAALGVEPSMPGKVADPSADAALLERYALRAPASTTGKASGPARPKGGRRTVGPAGGTRTEPPEPSVDDAVLPSGLDLEAARELRKRAVTTGYYRPPGPVREWAESHYHRLPLEAQGPDLIPVSGFWRDVASAGPARPFLSARVLEAHHHPTEILLALAMLDLPFQATNAPAVTGEGASRTLTAGGPVLVFVRGIRTARRDPRADGAPELLVSERFFRQDDGIDPGQPRRDLPVEGEFLAGVVHAGQVVVSNPGSTPVTAELLTQIPQGSVAVEGSQATRSQTIRLEPFSTFRGEYRFYFPRHPSQPVDQAHAPAGLTQEGRLVASARGRSLRVVHRLSAPDTGSWDHVSQQGSEAEVMAFLATNNLARLDLEKVAWRARERREFFVQLTGFLARRHVWSEPIARYALLHNDPAVLGEWLRHRPEFLAQCGPSLESPLLRIDPVEERTYEHLEYAPLIHPRAHPLGSRRRIANPVFREQYLRFLRVLAFRPRPGPDDELAAVTYLFLQDRTEEALARLARVKASEIRTRIQHDYLRAWAFLREEKPAEARRIAKAHEAHPVPRWQGLFAGLLRYLDEAEGKAMDAKAPGTDPAGRAPGRPSGEREASFDLAVENRTVALTWKGLDSVTVNYHRMDPEFLFSRSPFSGRDGEAMSPLRPAVSTPVTLPAGKSTLELAIPAALAKDHLLVEVIGGGRRKSRRHHAHDFRLQLSENEGVLEVRDPTGKRPLPKAYVKVYGRLDDGAIRFVKDGYTDLRGRFDYIGTNESDHPAALPEPGTPLPAPEPGGMDHPPLGGSEGRRIRRLAVLVLSETHGAAVREVDAPAR